MTGRLRRTSPVALALLAGAGVVLGRGLPLLFERTGGVAPPVPWAAPLGLFFLAACVGSFAWSTWVALHRDRRRMASDRAVRLLALAKASAIVGAIVLGGYLGFALAFVDSLETALPRERVVRSVIAAAGAACLVVAALLLERACEVPRDDDEDDGRTRVRRGHPA